MKSATTLKSLLIASMFAAPAFADDHATDATMEEPAPAVEEAAEESKKYSISGWLDQSMNFDSSAAGPAQAVYGLFEAAMRVGYDINENFGGYLQLNGRWNQNLTLTAGEDAFALFAREAYAYWQNDSGKVRIQAGKWYAPIGFELADPPDLNQHTNSNQFNYFLPTEVVGLISYLTLSDSVDLALYLTGGTDDDFAWANGFFGAPTIGERLGFSFGDAGLGISAIISDSASAGAYDTFLADIDFAIDFDSLSMAAEAALLTGLGAGSTLDYSVMAVVYGNVTDIWGLTGRAEMLAGDNFASPEIGLTASAWATFVPGWSLYLEVSEDLNDAGATGVHNTTGAVEIIFQFL